MIKSIRIFLSLLLIFTGITSLKAQTCSFIPATFYCTGTTTTLYGSAPSGSATWSSSDSNIAPISSSGVLTPLNPGLVNITYTVGNCNYTKEIEIRISPVLTPISPLVICSFTGINVPLSASTGTGTTYTWFATNNPNVNGESTSNQTSNPLFNTLTISSVQTTQDQIVNYNIIPKFNGCSGSTTILPVTVKPRPYVTISNVTTCVGEIGTLTPNINVNLLGGSYIWSNGQTGSTLSVLTTTNSNLSFSLSYTAPNGCQTSGNGATGTIVVRPAIVFSSNSVTICPGETRTISASTNVTGGTYLWSTGQTTQSISVNPSETTFYTVTYTIGQCGPVSDTSYVTVTPNLSVSLPAQYEICSGTSLQITPTYSHQGFGTYQWSNGSTSQSFSIVPPSTTTLTVTYSKALCSGTATASTTIIVKPTPTITQGSVTVCLNQPAVLSPTISVLGGTYLWSNGATTPSITINQATLTTTNYTLTYNLNGCTATRTISVFASNPPSLSVNSLTICSGSSGNLLATPSPTGGTFLWSTGQTTSQINVSPTSNSVYTVTYTRGFCNPVTASSTVSVINALNVSTVDYAICPGQSTTISPTYSLNNYGQYLWSNGATTPTITVTPNTTTSYSVTYSIPNCSSSFATSSSSTVNVTPSTITFSPTETICLGQSISISPNVSQVGGTYLWSTGATTSSIIVSPTTSSTYTLTYTLNGCSSSASKSIVVVTAPTINLSHSTICPNPNPLTVTATVSPSNSTLLWSTGATTSSTSLNIQNDTVYSVVATLNGCSSLPIEITVASNIALNSTINGANVCPGSPFPAITITPSHSGGTYTWSSGQTTNSITPTLAGLYTVTYNLVGCNQATRTFPITQDNCDFSQNSCENPNNLCTAVNFTYPNSTNKPNLGNVDCLGSTPNPTWFTMTISQAGTLNLLISQNSNSGQALDVDYIAWGPFNTTPIGCAAGGFPSGPVASCSYSGSNTENVTLNNVQVGQKYIFLLTNFSNQAGNISVVQNNTGSGSADCSVICDITEFTAIPTACVNNQYNLTGTLTFENPPSIGTLTVSNSCGGSQVFNPPFTSPLTYNITSLNANGSACSLTAVFSASSTCNSTASYTAPVACVLPCSIQSLTATPSACLNNQYSLSGNITFTSPPSTGTLTVSNSCGGFQTFNAPFTSPINYSFTGLAANGASCTVSATFSANMSCSESTNFTAPTSCISPCSIQSVTAVPSACLNNQYSLSGTVSFTNPPSSGTLTITNSCGVTQTFNAPFTSPINYSFTGLTANGASCTVSATFSANMSCSASTNFTAPTSCISPCSVQSLTAVPSACLNNQYSLSGSISFTNPPSSGTLTVTNSCGGSQTFNAPFTSPINYSITGLTADGASCTVSATFSANMSCSASTNFTAPVACVLPCSVQSVTAVSSACSNNQYSLSGTVSFTNPPSSGTLTITNSCGGTQTFNAPFTSPLNYSFTGLTANGANCTVTTVFSANASCTATTSFTAPTSCVFPCSIEGLTAVPSACSNNQYSLSGSVSFTNPPSSGTLTITNFCGGTQTFNAPFTSPIAYSFSDLTADGANCTVTTVFSANASCTATTSFTAPTSCSVSSCVIESINGVPSVCSSNLYSLDGVLVFSNPPSTGTLTLTACGSTQTFSPPFSSPLNFSFPDMAANGNSCSISATFSDIPCTGSSTFFAPIPCDCGLNTISISGPSVVCAGQPETLTANPALVGGTYLWSPNGETTQSITITPTDFEVYAVYYTLSSCFQIGEAWDVDVIQPTQPTFNQVGDICFGDALSSLPGMSINSILGGWSPSMNNQETTTYTFTPNQGICANTATMTIGVNSGPTFTLPPNQSICVGDNFATSVFADAPSGTVFSWTNDNPAIGLATSGSGDIASFEGINTTISNQTATISVVASLNGCSTPVQTFELTVKPRPTAIASISNQDNCCGNTSTEINFTSDLVGTTYNWTNDNPNIGLGNSGAGTITSFTVVNPTSVDQTATLTVTPELFGCFGTPITTSILAHPCLNVSNNSIAPICAGETTQSIQLTSSVSGVTFDWTNSNTSVGLPASGNGIIPSFTAINISQSPNTASISVIPSLGTCTGDAVILSLVVNPIPSVTVNSLTICEGQSGTLTATPSILGGTYAWTPIGQTSSSITVNPTTNSTYGVVYTLNGCSSNAVNAQVDVTPAIAFAISASSPTTINQGESVVLTSSYTSADAYQWYYNGQIISGANAISYTANTTGSYSLQITVGSCSSNAPIVTVTVQNETDTDGDGVPDNGEVLNGTDPTEPCDFVLANQILTPTTAWNQLDCDSDGLGNGTEVTDGTDPQNPDTDGDGVTDGTEVGNNTIPLEPCDFVLANQTLTPSNEWNLLDCDSDGVTNETEVLNGTNPLSEDTDGDGVSDGVELNDLTDANDPCSFILANQTMSPSAIWLTLDCDGDDLTNGEEGDLETDPLDPDTDGDTFPDGEEVDAGTDPLDPNDYPQDADGDGVPDNTELADGTNPNDQCDFVLANQVLPPSTIWNQTDCDLDGVLNQEEINIGTNPLNPDTDSDGVIDGTEIADNTNPLDPCDLLVVSQTILPVTNWNLLDCDTDGLTNGNEITANTDPFNPDTDGDGVLDGTEVIDATNPLGNCSFVLANQTMTSSTIWVNLDCDFDGLPNGEEVTIGSNPLNPDTDGDGVKDSQEVIDNTSPTNPCSFILSSQTLVPTTAWNQQDCDTDGLTNEEEVTAGTNPTNEDTDGDGVIDGTEIADATNPLEACSFILTSQTVTPSLAWSSLDCDEDGLTNEEEVTGGTNPTNADTDGDGVIDGTEISDLTDPLVACNFILASQTVAPSIAWNSLDCDEDGLTNEEEITGGSNPLNGCDPNNTGPNCQDTVLLQIPEIFTPNNDGINETFEIPGLEDYPNNSIQIFNRWGAEVFSKTAYQNEWNGSTTSNLVIGEGELPTGTYYYILDLNGDGSTIYKGYVYLKR